MGWLICEGNSDDVIQLADDASHHAGCQLSLACSLSIRHAGAVCKTLAASGSRMGHAVETGRSPGLPIQTQERAHQDTPHSLRIVLRISRGVYADFQTAAT